MEISVNRILHRLLCTPVVVTAIAIGMVAPSYAAESVAAVTTYSALTQKNTSAVVMPDPQSQTSTPSANVSKAPVGSVLPAGLSPRIYAHFLTWFGTPDHMDVGYSSADGVQVEQQIADMISRGISGVIVNWQGASTFTNQGASLIMTEAESHTGTFEFAIEEDSAALAECAATSRCDLAAKAIDDLKYIQTTYAGAKSYMKYQDRPVIFLYGMEAYKLDWDKIRSSISGNPVLVFRPRPATGGSNPPSRSAQLAPGPLFDFATPVSPRADWGMHHA